MSSALPNCPHPYTFINLQRRHIYCDRCGDVRPIPQTWETRKHNGTPHEQWWIATTQGPRPEEQQRWPNSTITGNSRTEFQVQLDNSEEP